MPRDPLEDRMVDGDAPPEPTDAELHEPDDPTDDAPPAPPGGPAAPAPPAVPPVDDKGVSWKNRTMEARRKLSKAERAAAEQAKENQRLRAELATARAASTVQPTPAVASPNAQTGVPSAPARQPAALPYDIEVLKTTPLHEWPEAALLDLKRESPGQFGADVDTILADRQADKVAQRVELKASIKQMDKRIQSAYPAMRDANSVLYRTVQQVQREWGIDLRTSPLALEGLVNEAARRTNIQPVVIEVSDSLRSRMGAVASPDGTVIPPREQPAPKPAALTQDQLEVARRMGVDPAKLAKEVEITNNLPLVSAGVEK